MRPEGWITRLEGSVSKDVMWGESLGWMGSSVAWRGGEEDVWDGQKAMRLGLEGLGDPCREVGLQPLQPQGAEGFLFSFLPSFPPLTLLPFCLKII